MVEFKGIGLVKSLTDHDKDKLYIVASIQREYVYLSGGGGYPLSKQKHKNRKHLQLADEHDETLKRKLAEGTTVRDEDIIGFIRNRKQ